MIELFQHKKIETAVNYYSKLDPIKINLDKSIIDSDIKRLNVYLENPTNNFDKDNIKALIKYLKKLSSLAEKNETEICWNIKEDIPHSYPIEFIDESVYSINTCNYMGLNKEQHLVEVELSELIDIIAFEIMYEDLGETHESMENKLSECGILGFENSKIITDIINNNKDNHESIYILSKKLKIGETAYYSHTDKVIYDYFLNKEFKDTTYRQAVEHSCRYASAIIANSILKNAYKFKENIKPIMINSKKIAFITNTDDMDKINAKIIDAISIRAFGRQFIIKPKISVF